MITYRTLVRDLPATPLGLLPATVVVEHWCSTCLRQVDLPDLVSHAHTHGLSSSIQHEGGAID